jgi:hypothetical protein
MAGYNTDSTAMKGAGMGGLVETWKLAQKTNLLEKQIAIAGYKWRLTKITDKSYTLDNYNGTIFNGSLVAIDAEIKRLEDKALPDETPDYSHCRGEFPRVCWARDYNHERGEFPHIEKTKPQPKPKIDRATEQAKETLKRLTKLYKGELEFEGGNLVEVEKIGKPKGNGSPHHAAWIELNEACRSGEVVRTGGTTIPRIMSSVADETPRQVMAKAIPRAIASIPQSWDDHDKIKLPYGFYMQRKGFDEARIYHPKHRGSIPAGFLGKGWQINPSHQLRNSLDVIEGIIKRNKLDKPTPPTTSPASNPVERAA